MQCKRAQVEMRTGEVGRGLVGWSMVGSGLCGGLRPLTHIPVLLWLSFQLLPRVGGKASPCHPPLEGAVNHAPTFNPSSVICTR